jgi:hypothetical protein
MREAVRVVLELTRYACLENIDITDALIVLIKRFEITSEESVAIAEIVKADIREKWASHPAYGSINRVLQRMSADNPYGRERRDGA